MYVVSKEACQEWLRVSEHECEMHFLEVKSPLKIQWILFPNISIDMSPSLKVDVHCLQPTSLYPNKYWSKSMISYRITSTPPKRSQSMYHRPCIKTIGQYQMIPLHTYIECITVITHQPFSSSWYRQIKICYTMRKSAWNLFWFAYQQTI